MEQLHQALATRDLIGQAKGILMERFKHRWPPSYALTLTTDGRTI